MKLSYNSDRKVLEIEDDLKTHQLLMKFLFAITLINSCINLYGSNWSALGVFKIIWLFVGAVSLIVLYFLFFKESVQKEIPIDAIDYLKEKTVFGRTRFTLKLKNGKYRKLASPRTEEDLNYLRNIFKKAGITIVR